MTRIPSRVVGVAVVVPVGVVGAVPAEDRLRPLPGVARGVEDAVAVRAEALLAGPDQRDLGAGVLPPVVERGLRLGQLHAEAVVEPVGAARRLLPLGLGRHAEEPPAPAEAPGEPAAVGVRLVPGHEHDRQLVAAEAGVARVRRRESGGGLGQAVRLPPPAGLRPARPVVVAAAGRRGSAGTRRSSPRTPRRGTTAPRPGAAGRGSAGLP